MSRTAARLPARHVFVIEDDDAVRDSLTMIIDGAGLPVSAYADGKTFLKEAAPGRDDFIVLDLDMPTMSGTAIAAELKARGSKTPIAIISGLRSCAYASGVAQVAPVAAFRKPLKPDDLLNALTAPPA